MVEPLITANGREVYTVFRRDQMLTPIDARSTLTGLAFEDISAEFLCSIHAIL